MSTTRRALLIGGLALLGAPLGGEAQQVGKMAKIGFLVSVPVPDHDGLLNGLNDLGYVEGRNISIERRNAEGHRERLSDLAADLVRAGVDVIVAQGDAGARAARNVTASIPIVFVTLSDPVALGIADSLARPGGNVTGVSLAAAEISGKHLELLKDAVPKLSRAAVLTNPNNRSVPTLSRQVETAARSLGVRIQFVDARGPADLDGAFAAIMRRRPSRPSRSGILRRAATDHRVRQPQSTAGDLRGVLAVGECRRPHGVRPELVGYVPSGSGLRRQDPARSTAGRASDRAPTRFVFTINLKTAKAIGLTIPPAVLLRADQVIDQ